MLSYFVIAPILTAIFLYVFSTAKAARMIAIAAQAVLAGFAAHLFYLCKEGERITNIGDFEGVLGITLRADTLTSVFIVLTAFIFFVAAVYSFNDNNDKLFWLLLFIWEGLLIGVFLSRDLFNIFVLIEVATVVVSILIMFNRDRRSMYDGMFNLMVSIVVMQFYLFGTGYIYKLTGVLDMEAAASALSTLDKSSLVLPYALIMTAIGLKCAMAPLFSWLPKAHGTPGAPAAVSALLSGLHVKSGIYLFMRFQTIFQGIDVSGFFIVIGIITGVTGFIFAISQTDIKLIPAYSTISQIGMIMVALNIDDAYSYTGGLYHVINHAFFKSALFLISGVIAQVYATRNINEIRGVLRKYPLVCTAAIIAILGITGAPLLNGSISKYFIMSGTNWQITAAIILINLGTIITFIKYSRILFRDKKRENESEESKNIENIEKNKQAAILIPCTFCFIGGIFGEQFIEFLFNINVSLDAAGYLEKAAIFAGSGAAGYFIFKYYVNKSALFKRIREIDLSFRAMCVSIGSFFAAILITTGLIAG